MPPSDQSNGSGATMYRNSNNSQDTSNLIMEHVNDISTSMSSSSSSACYTVTDGDGSSPPFACYTVTNGDDYNPSFL